MKLQKHNTEVHGIRYKNGLHCTARILRTEGVCFFVNLFFFSFNQNCAFLIDYYVTVHVVRFLGTK